MLAFSFFYSRGILPSFATVATKILLLRSRFVHCIALSCLAPIRCSISPAFHVSQWISVHFDEGSGEDSEEDGDEGGTREVYFDEGSGDLVEDLPQEQ